MPTELPIEKPIQANISSDYEFKKFLLKPGLLDVYSEWCGPCLGMVGSLRRIKEELGGNKLQLAICKSDTITSLRRFHKKSEPTWLFVTMGKAVNIMFGTNVPKLMALIESELQLLDTENRPMYQISQLQPEELVRLRKKSTSSSVDTIGDKWNESSKNLNYGTDGIIDKLTQIDVMFFGPKGDLDVYQKLKSSQFENLNKS